MNRPQITPLLERRSQIFAQAAGLLVGALGVVALIGWWLNVEALKCIVPGSTPLKPNIAAGFVLCGAGLVLLSRKKVDKWLRHVIAAAALLLIALAVATLGETFFGWNLGIDQWLIRAAPGAASSSQRMMPTTAFCFLLTGSALLAEAQLIWRRFRCPLVAGLSAPLVIVGVLGLGGFFMEIRLGPRWNLLGMSLSGVSAVVGFLVFGGGLLALLESKSELAWSLSPLASAGFALAILLMVVTTASAFTFAKQMLETNKSVSHRQEVLKVIQEVMTDMVDLASRERVYIITGNEQLLKEREQTKARTRENFSDVRKLTSDNPNQQRRLDQLEPLIAERIDWEEQLIALRREAGFDETAELVAAGPGLRLSDDILRGLNEMQNEEYRVLDSDRKRAESASTATFLLLPLGVFLSLAILSLGVFFLNAGMSEQKQAEKALRQSEEGMRAVLKSALDSIITMDHQGRVVAFNPAAEKTFGYRHSEAVGQLLADLIIPPSLREQHRRGLSRYLATGEAPVLGKRLELTAVRRNGSEFPVELAITRVGEQEPPLFTGFIRDITERKRAECEIRQLNVELEQRVVDRTAELRSSEARYRTLFDSIDEGFCIIEMIFDEQEKPVDYRFLQVNPSFEKQTGLRDALGKRMRELAPRHETHWFETYGRIAVSGEAARFQNHAEQLHRWYDVYACRFGESKNRQVAIVFSDITERKTAEAKILQLNAELRQQAAELEVANKELEAFSYSVSHDLRAPLRAVDGFSQAVMEDYGAQLPQEGRQYLQTIREGAQRMGVLIDDLLTFSRLSRLPLNKAPVNMKRLAREAFEELKGQQNGRKIDIRIGGLAPCEGDPALLKQVWVNLLSNAIKYTRKREEAVVEVGSTSDKGETAYFVSDNGVGFDMEYAHKLFGVFQRLHRSDEFEGTGVGLAIVQRVVHRHGGRVWAEAEVDRGASFYFTMKEANKI